VRERYTLKLKSGHTIKIRKGETYEVNFDDIKLSFEEHPPGVNLGVHTHVWVEAIDDPDPFSFLLTFAHLTGITIVKPISAL